MAKPQKIDIREYVVVDMYTTSQILTIAGLIFEFISVLLTARKLFYVTIRDWRREPSDKRLGKTELKEP